MVLTNMSKLYNSRNHLNPPKPLKPNINDHYQLKNIYCIRNFILSDATFVYKNTRK